MMRQPKPDIQRRKWSSAHVAMSLLSAGGLLGISACEPVSDSTSAQNEQRRNQYQSRAECEADYSAKECEPQVAVGPVVPQWHPQAASSRILPRPAAVDLAQQGAVIRTEADNASRSPIAPT